MGVFEFLTIGIVSLSVGSVVKAWIKHRGNAQRLALLEDKVKLLDSGAVEARLSVVEDIVTGTSDVDRQIRQLEREEAYRQLPA